MSRRPNPVPNSRCGPGRGPQVNVADAYEVLSARGYQYGPAFQNLTAMWRRGDEIFAEVKLGQDVPVAGLGVHPRCSTAPCTR